MTIMSKKALICGVSGQDGAYLAALLLSKGYTVVGTSRDASSTEFNNLRKLNILNHLEITSMCPSDFHSTHSVIEKVKPDEIYNLSGQTSVGLSFEQPLMAIESILTGTLNLLESLRLSDKDISLYNAGSSECFGDTMGIRANEKTKFSPKSPYAVSKASSFWLAANYRKAYGLKTCTGLLFNHESPFRASRFVTQKIIHSAYEISRDKSLRLELGNLDIYRDWGWAPEYVEAMWLMLQQKQLDDFVIATGHTISLKEFVAYSFSYFGLDWQEYVSVNKSLFRPSDFKYSAGDPSYASKNLNWTAKIKADKVVELMCEEIVKSKST